MPIKGMGRHVLPVFAGLFSCVVTAYGLRSALGIDIHFDPVLSTLYLALPILSLPVFFLARPFRKLALLQPILAIAYLAAYSALNWRTCASFGFCSSVSATVLLTLRTHSVLAFFAAAILSIATVVTDAKTASRRGQK